jgi:hypothetical protein
MIVMAQSLIVIPSINRMIFTKSTTLQHAKKLECDLEGSTHLVVVINLRIGSVHLEKVRNGKRVFEIRVRKWIAVKPAS